MGNEMREDKTSSMAGSHKSGKHSSTIKGRNMIKKNNTRRA